MVDIREQHDVRAICFPTGTFARRYPYPAAITRALDAGHLMGNHSDTHPRLTRLTDADVLTQIDGGIPGTQTPGLLRPPYGAYDQRIVDLAATRGYHLCTWTIASRDSTGASADEIIANAQKVGPGGVIIMHPNAPNTAEALPGVIAAIRAKGLTLPSLTTAPPG